MFTDQLGGQLAGSEESIFLWHNRNEGNRILQQCAKQRCLLNVRCETPYTLATEICSSVLSCDKAPQLLDDMDAINLMLAVLCATKNLFFCRPGCQTLAAAQELYRSSSEVRQAKIESFNNNEKQAATQEILTAYQKAKEDCNAWDCCDVLINAVDLADSKDWENIKFVTLDVFSPTKLEKAVLKRVCNNSMETIDTPMENEETVLKHLTKHTRFIRCRGIETELRFVFSDILHQKNMVEDCAVVYPSSEYAQRLYEMAARYHIPVTISEGIPLHTSRLFDTVKMLHVFAVSDCDVEQLIPLLQSKQLRPKHPIRLATALRKKKIGWGKERYQYLFDWTDIVEENRPDDDTLNNWKQFFSLIFKICKPAQNQPIEDTILACQTLLMEFADKQTASESAAYTKTIQLLSGLSTRLSDAADVLIALIAVMEVSKMILGTTEQDSLLCVPLQQGFTTGRKIIYGIGLSRYVLEEVGAESPILTDAEREQLSDELLTTSKRIEEKSKQFFRFLSCGTGQLILSYPDFDTQNYSELSPAPIWTTALAYCAEQFHTQSEVFTFLPESPITPIEYLTSDSSSKETAFEVQSPPPHEKDYPKEDVVSSHENTFTLQPAQTFEDLLKNYVFSPSSLETALDCPLHFYLEKILRLREPQKIQRNFNGWLEPKALGTFVHNVLETIFDNFIHEKKPDFNAILEAETEQALRENPAVAQELIEEDLNRIRTMCEYAVNWYTNEHDFSKRTAIMTEYAFGASGEDNNQVSIKIGDTSISLVGSIDRIDRLSSNKYEIVDYKTGNPYRFKQKLDQHLQHYLYTLAAEKIESVNAVDAASYLFLKDGAEYLKISQTKEKRREMSELIDFLLDVIKSEETIQTPKPCYRKKKGIIDTGSKTERNTAYRYCQHYCPYAELCVGLCKSAFGGKSDD